MAARRLSPFGRYQLRVVLFVLSFTLVAVPFGFLLHQVLSDGPITTFDEDWAAALNDAVHDHPLVIDLLDLISFTGKPIFLLFAVGIPGAWVLARGGRKLAVFLAVTCIGGGVVDSLVKLAVGRPRPEVDHPVHHAFGKSFPSGHSMQSVVCYGALVLVLLPLIPERWRRPAIGAVVVWAITVGLSRLALGVHYVSDVVGGWTLGAAWLAMSVAAFEIWREDRGRRPTKPLAEGVEPEEAEVLTDA